MCPVQRDGGAVERAHASDDRRVGSGCKWKKENVTLCNGLALTLHAVKL